MTISLSQLVIGIESSLIILPVIVIVVTFFRTGRPRPPKNPPYSWGESTSVISSSSATSDNKGSTSSYKESLTSGGSGYSWGSSSSLPLSQLHHGTVEKSSLGYRLGDAG